MREIPQRELRNDIGRVLREVAAGETIRVTVRGKPVADLVPVTDRPAPRRFVPWHEVVEAFRHVRLSDDERAAFLSDIDEATDEEPRDPFADHG